MKKEQLTKPGLVTAAQETAVKKGKHLAKSTQVTTPAKKTAVKGEGHLTGSIQVTPAKKQETPVKIKETPTKKTPRKIKRLVLFLMFIKIFAYSGYSNAIFNNQQCSYCRL